LTSYLITTTDRSRWPNSGHLVFIGTFCLPDDPESLKEKYTYVISDISLNPELKLPYFQVSQALHSSISHNLAATLNRFHDTDESERYWSIITGAWLRSFIDLVVSRAVVLSRIRRQHNDLKLIAADPASCFRAAGNYVEFLSFTKSPEWNSIVFSDIWSHCSTVERFTPPRLTDLNFGSNTKTQLITSKYVLSATYLPRLKEALLSLTLGTLPRRIKVVQPPTVESNSQLRKQLNLGTASGDDFEIAVNKLIIDYLPTGFLEGFNDLKRMIPLMKFPQNPKSIFTANRHIYDDVFNAWVANATSQGSSLILGQHGGYFGISKYPSFAERHELSIADRYITWGWKSSPIAVSGPILTTIGMNKKSIARGSKLVVVTEQLWSLPRSIFSDFDDSPIYSQHLESCIHALPSSIRDATKVRLHPSDGTTAKPMYDWWKQHLPDIEIDDCSDSFRKTLKGAKLIVVAHNSTTLPETFSMNIPTLVSWKPEWVEIRDSAKPVFDKLEEVGIFHSDSEALARHITAIWGDVDKWWQSAEVRDARKLFCASYAQSMPRPLRFLRSLLKESNS
jgi:putative transferase (TIGR04331 family)